MITYSELKNTITQYLDFYDEELVAKIDFFIDTAEKEIARTVRIPSYESITELRLVNPTGDRDTVTIPADYLESKDMFEKSTSQIVSMANLAFIMRKRSGVDKSSEGTGRYYARIGRNFLVYPALEEGESLILNYYADPANLREGQDTSYILTIAPDLLLYLALKHAYIFLSNDEAAGKYQQLAQSSFEQIKEQVYKMDNKPSMKVVPRRF